MTRYPRNKGFVITQRKESHVTLRNENVVTVVPAVNKKMRIKTHIAACQHKQRKICRRP